MGSWTGSGIGRKIFSAAGLVAMFATTENAQASCETFAQNIVRSIGEKYFSKNAYITTFDPTTSLEVLKCVGDRVQELSQQNPSLQYNIRLELHGRTHNGGFQYQIVVTPKERI